MPTPSNELYSTIPLTQGQFAIVDVTSYDWLMQWKWCAHWSPSTHSFYAVRRVPLGNNKRESIYMHRQILGLRYGDKRRGDHRNHDTLDDRRENLRIVSQVENCQNQKVRSDNKTGCKGVCVYKGRRYRSKISVKGVEKHLGYFHLTPEGLQAATDAYLFAADLYFGEFAFLAIGTKGRQEEKCGQKRCLQKPNKTGCKGVGIHHGIKYRAKIWVNGKEKHLGYFPLTPDGLERASGVYNFAVGLYHGEPN